MNVPEISILVPMLLIAAPVLLLVWMGLLMRLFSAMLKKGSSETETSARSRVRRRWRESQRFAEQTLRRIENEMRDKDHV